MAESGENARLQYHSVGTGQPIQPDCKVLQQGQATGWLIGIVGKSI
jgi:hypothetical protein